MLRQPVNRAGLDRERVVRAAAELVNHEGAESLTINRLARELSVRPSSLYNHIHGLEDLWHELALLNLRNLGERLTSAAVGRSGAAGVLAVAKAYRAYVKEYPGLYQSSLRASGNHTPPDPKLQSAEEHIVRVVLALVESFGLSGVRAIDAVRALRSAVHGFATLEVTGGFGLPLDLDESFQQLIEMIIHGMQQKGYR